MPAPFANIGRQVATDLFELGKGTVKSMGQAGADLVGDTVEQLTGYSGVGAQVQTGMPKNHEQDSPDREKAIRAQKEKQRYNQVLGELEQYRQRKQQQDAQIARERAQQEQEKQQREAGEKQKKESFVQSLLKRVGAGSHGETAKQKE